MGEVVADQFQRRGGSFIVLMAMLPEAVDRPLQVDMRAVEAGRDRGSWRGWGDGGGDLGGGDAGGIVARIAIRGMRRGDLGHRCPSSSVWRPRNARLLLYGGGRVNGLDAECQCLPGMGALRPCCALRDPPGYLGMDE